MAETLIPDHVDARKIFAKHAEIEGKLPVQRMRRLAESLANDEGDAHARLTFSTDDSRRRVISGEVEAQVNAVCQRCLDPVRIGISDSLNLAIVLDEEQAKRLPADLDPWVCADDETLSLPALVEEQLILSMPLVSYHPEGECTGEPARIQGMLNTESGDERSEAESPFAMLKNLKNLKKHDS